MHIPDGYLSPQTELLFTGVMVAVWARASSVVRRVVRTRWVPLLAIGAAFSFLIMMFNVPIPDGTTAHAVGAVLIAILLGPWAAVIAVSIALLVQALFFGDGGVLAFTANAFNMAVVGPFVGYAVYRLLARRAPLTSPRRVMAAGVGGYVGLNAAALVAAVEFGLQPELFHTANGTPLYAPFHLSQTIPAMMLAHLTVAGFVELAVTAGVVAYLQRANLPILAINHPGIPVSEAELASRRRPGWRWAVVGFGILVLLTPLGLLAPGGAFGEEAPSDLALGRYGLKAVPTGLARFSGFWSHAVLGGYGFKDGQSPVLGYLLSAVLGIAVIGALVAVGWVITRSVMRLRSARATAAHRPELVAVRPAPAAPRVRRNSRATPAWLTSNEVALCPCGCIGRRTKGSFVEKTLNGGSNVLRQAMYSDDISGRDGFLQRLDPRVKIVSLLALLLAAALVRHISVLVSLYALTVALAWASKLPVWSFVKRVWLFVPLFTGIVVLPAAFSFITHGTIVVTLWHWNGNPVGLTEQGLTAVGLIVSRVAVSISLVVLLTLTTPWVRLLSALRALFVPRIFVLIVGMAYRYIFLLLNSVTDMYAARKSRSVGNAARADVRTGRQFVAGAAGALFGKAHALSDEVHHAMVSRGYTGTPRTLAGLRVRTLDWVLVGATAALTVAVLGGDRILGR